MNNNYLVVLIFYAIALFIMGLNVEDRNIKLIIFLLLGLIPILLCTVGVLS